jgi:hypothetical protein
MRTRTAVTLFAAAALCFALFEAVGRTFLDGFALDLGSVGMPRPRHLYFLVDWTVLGLPGIVLAAVGAAGLAARGDRAERWGAAWSRPRAAVWVGAGSLLAFAVPVAIRTFVTDGNDLTDDESAYRFMAELLASGRLSVPSHPLKAFFDRAFMINDGTLYAKYFLGWPALMLPGVLLGATGWTNAVYSALTVPAVYLVSRRLAGDGWARGAVVLFVASPMAAIAAATELSHTTCLLALAWTTWLVLRSRDAEVPVWVHAGVAVLFSLAFFIRPLAAIGIGVPLLGSWAHGVVRGPGRRRVAAALAFALPAVAGAALFLAVNRAQTGSFTETAYQRYFDYARENGFRFTDVKPHEAGKPPELRFDEPPVEVLAKNGAALLRLNWALFGWPCSFLFLFFAGAGPAARLPWAAFATFLVTHSALDDIGIDTFGPTHYFEILWPVLLLTVLGLERATRVGASVLASPQAARLARVLPATLAAMLVLSMPWGYARVRLAAIARIVEDVGAPLEAARRERLSDAIVFAYRPFSMHCRSQPTKHFKLWRPNNDPDLGNDVLWVNHLSVPEDRALMQHFPGRTGWVMLWDKACEVRVLPLDRLDPSAVPVQDGKIHDPPP